MVRVIAAAFAVCALGGCTLLQGIGADDASGTEPVETNPVAISAELLARFAVTPTKENWRALPLADEVDLGLGDEILVTRTADELRDPAAWTLEQRLWRGGAGTYSALETIAEEATERGIAYKRGSVHRCTNPPGARPEGLDGLRQMNVLPFRWENCGFWFAVAVFVDEAGTIHAVTLDRFEP